MKLNLYLFSFLAIYAIAVSDAHSQTFSIGPKAGLGISWLTNVAKTDYIKREPFFGAVGGLATNYAFSKNVSLQTELLFIQKGQRWKSTDVESRTRFYFNCLELPILLQGAFQAGSAQMYFNAGGYLSVALNGKQVTHTTTSGQPETTKDNLIFGGAGNYNRFDAGIPFGLGWIIGAGKGNLLVDLRFEIGFVNLKNGGGNSQGQNNHWRCGTVSVAYMFPTGSQH